MRFGILAVLLLGLVAAIAQIAKGTAQFSKTNADAAVPVALTNVSVLATEVTFLGKSAPRTDNTGDIYVGTTSGNDTQAFKISPGGEAVIKVQNGLINLSHWYVDVTSASDGVTVIYR